MSVSYKGLRPSQAAEKLGIGLSSLWAKAKSESGFPQPVKLGPATTVFIEHELDAYIAKCIAESRKQAAA
ncbi:helix-turn-helix transcriptional regulator [Burkholderia gladioli]|uniref:helix-turn-helix transcriptional regulator n=1 Tax=Burkholderia gladioli TaxID=28095 RepID=UPI00163ED807|nr:AlpA family phage regulatory protein [Burkholderia gladioli]URV24860.1 AlpA family phage regulatory protein [Burkholderia gladioli]